LFLSAASISQVDDSFSAALVVKMSADLRENSAVVGAVFALLRFWPQELGLRLWEADASTSKEPACRVVISLELSLA
jgi:hypothetical protein